MTAHTWRGMGPTGGGGGVDSNVMAEGIPAAGWIVHCQREITLAHTRHNHMVPHVILSKLSERTHQQVRIEGDGKRQTQRVLPSINVGTVDVKAATANGCLIPFVWCQSQEPTARKQSTIRACATTQILLACTRALPRSQSGVEGGLC
jgi:hypothetical protein